LALYQQRESTRDVFATCHIRVDLTVHVQRVRQGGYAFIWDSPTVRYEISNDCDLMEIGAPFDNKGYAFATQKHAAYNEKLSWALLKLNDAGILYRLERK